MSLLRLLHADRRRAQQGSVLSGVMIITAFIAIIAGAMMTELSANFTLSHVAVNKVANEATVKSAIEISLDSLQNSALANGCPALPGALTLNGRTAVASYLSCAPVVDVRSPQFIGIASSAAFSIDAAHTKIPASLQDFYLVGDSAGMVYQYQFGQTSAAWVRNLKTTITGPPVAMQDAFGWPNPPDVGNPPPFNADISYLVPIVGGIPGCPASFCVEFMGEDTRTSPAGPDVYCFIPTNAMVTSRPAAGIANPLVAFFGDSGGTLYANTNTEFSCGAQASAVTPGSAAIVAGPIVFANGARDEVFVVTSQGSASQLLDYTYDPNGPSLTLAENLSLPFSNPVGLALEKTNGLEKTSSPARVVITFAGGGVELANINASYDPSLQASNGLGTGITGAPYWCSCPAGPQIGVAGVNGTLYLLDASLGMVASYAGGSPVHTSPASDGVGEWFYGSDDGYMHEVQQRQSTMVEVARNKYGPFGAAVGSSVQVGACPAGICIYLGALNGKAYLVPLNARDATITACLSDAPPVCSGVNPRLWTQAEVGDGSSPRTVHVRGWSYYSP